MSEIGDATLELALRRARMRAAAADPQRSSSDVVAALAAGVGAELVARQNLAREVLAVRLAKRRRA